MSNLLFSPSALEDLEGIFDHIAADNPAAAGRFAGTIKGTCSTIAAFPGMGVAREDLAPGVRSFPVGNYLIFYRSIEAGIEIVRVLHGSRDYLRLLD